LASELRKDPRYIGQPWTELMADVVKRGDGLIVPVYRGEDPKAGLIFGGERPDTSAIARSTLQVIAHAAVDRYFELRDGASLPSAKALTVRETQCLRMVAVGRTDADVGQLLGISPRTVRFHIDSTKTKLGVTTRIQAVAKALRDKIIAV
jgi:DNA-binding CsgD family transcriptional regulator